MSVRNPILLPQVKDLLTNPSEQNYLLIENQSMRLVAWTVSGKTFLQKEYQKGLQTLSRHLGEREQQLITNRPGESGLAGVLKNMLIPLIAL